MKNFFILILLISSVSKISHSAPPVDNHIKIDQFGYRPSDRKICVISNPITGYNSTSPFTPGTNYQIRKFSDDAVVYSGTITQWRSGATQFQSGDKGWRFDFTALYTPGTYYVYDVTNNVRSYEFIIDENVYAEVLKQAFRVFYYQRCGTPKAAPYAQTGWTDGACHNGALQDIDCRLYNNNSPTTSKNLSGGWHDAGDYNKYINFAFEPMMDLMHAYLKSPVLWTDNFNIPESGNGIPDILDEVKYELDWFLKMQNLDGSVLSIVGVTNFASASPPSADANPRKYGPATTSATLTSAAVFALASKIFAGIGQTAYATILQTAAINAWNWANISANTNITFYNAGVIGAGEQEVSEYERFVRKMAAAVYLYSLTGNSTYKTFFDNNYSQMHMIQWQYAYPFEAAAQELMLYYTTIPGSSITISNAIKSAYTNSLKTNNADNLPAYLNDSDVYRAYLKNDNYTWGSNTTKARQGNMFINMISYNLDTASSNDYRQAALGYVNNFHGVTPTAFAYLTNMGNYGAENSVTEIYHAWFTDGSALWDKAGTSVFGPPPGFVPGGPNPQYALDGCCPSGCGGSNSLCNTSLVTPPLNQPIQKSYKDWNTSWPQNSWTITEPAIYTQAAYVRLISHFVKPASASQLKIVIQGFYNNALNNMNMKDTVRAYLRNNFTPYNIVDSSKAVIDSVSFTGSFTFNNAVTGTYYIVTDHRSSIETWSRNGGEVYSSSVNYDFTTDSSKAYGNNIVNVSTSPVIYAIYNGDINETGTIDLNDIIAVFNASVIFAVGYVVTDVTGDRITNLNDIVLTFNNAGEFVSLVRP